MKYKAISLSKGQQQVLHSTYKKISCNHNEFYIKWLETSLPPPTSFFLCLLSTGSQQTSEVYLGIIRSVSWYYNAISYQASHTIYLKLKFGLWLSCLWIWSPYPLHSKLVQEQSLQLHEESWGFLKKKRKSSMYTAVMLMRAPVLDNAGSPPAAAV